MPRWASGADGTNALRDLEAVQRLLSSPVFLALYDLPWVPVFLAGIAMFHPWLGDHGALRRRRAGASSRC